MKEMEPIYDRTNLSTSLAYPHQSKVNNNYRKNIPADGNST